MKVVILVHRRLVGTSRRMLGAPVGRLGRSTLVAVRRKLNKASASHGQNPSTGSRIRTVKIPFALRNFDNGSAFNRLYSTTKNTSGVNEDATSQSTTPGAAADNSTSPTGAASAAADASQNQNTTTTSTEADTVKTPTPNPEATEKNQQQQEQQGAAGEKASEGEKTSTEDKPSTPWPEESDWPPVSALSTPWFAFSGAIAAGFIYLWFAVTDEKFLDVIDFLEGGAAPDRLQQLRRIKRWLLYESMGVEVTRRLATNGIIQAVFAALNDKDPHVRHSIHEVLAEFSKYDRTRQALVQANVVDTLRRDIHRDNYDVAWVYANVSREPLAAAQIASDEFILDQMLDILESTQNHLKTTDYVTLRAIFTVFGNLTQDPANIERMSSTCKDRIQTAFLRMYPVDPIIVQQYVNTRSRIVTARPQDYPELVSAVEAVGGPEETPNTLWKVGLVHHALITLTAGAAWSWYSGRKIAKKYAPLKISERAWLRRMMWRSPLAAVAMSFTWMGLEPASRYVSSLLDWNDRNAPRKAYLPYMVQIPAYYFALSFAPFALLPSLVQFKWRQDGPPKYLMLAGMANDALVDLGFFDPYYVEDFADPSGKDEPAEETKKFIKDSEKAMEGLLLAAERQQHRQPRRWL